MIKVNNKKIEYSKSVLSVMYDNSINPTGLGSVGISFEINEVFVYLGIKFDVISVLTNKNIHTFINLEKKDVDNYKESLYGNKEYSIDDIPKKQLHQIHINDLLIEIDVKALLKSIYIVDKDLYFNIIKDKVFKDNKSYGGILHYYSNSNVRQTLLNIGLLSSNNKDDKLIVNNNVINKSNLDREYYYSIWWLKQSITTEHIKVNCPVKKYETLNISKDESIYIDYFNKLSSINGGKQIYLDDYEILPDNKTTTLTTINHLDIINNDNDTWVIDGVANSPGIKDNFIQTNYGLKEARKGYFDLEKGNSFKNIGYVANNGIFGDNFYVQHSGEDKNNIFLNKGLPKISFSSNKTIMKLLSNVFNFSGQEFIEFVIYCKQPNNKLESIKIAKYFIQSLLPGNTNTLSLQSFINNIDIKLPIPMLAKKDKLIKFSDVKNTIAFVVNPFYKKTFFKVIKSTEDIIINQNEIYALDKNNHKFGFSYDKFFWNNIPKDFRLNIYKRDHFGNIKFKDLNKEQSFEDVLSPIDMKPLNANSFLAKLDNITKKFLNIFKYKKYTIMKEYATVYVVDINELKPDFKDDLLKYDSGFILI